MAGWRSGRLEIEVSGSCVLAGCVVAKEGCMGGREAYWVVVWEVFGGVCAGHSGVSRLVAGKSLLRSGVRVLVYLASWTFWACLVHWSVVVLVVWFLSLVPVLRADAF